MKRTLFRLVAGFIVPAFMLLQSMNGFAAQKRTIDTIKIPQLNQFKLAEIQKAETPNGIKLRLVKDDKLPIVSMQFIIKGGDVFDPIDKKGLSGLMTDLIKIGGTKEHKPEELDKIIDSQGITVRFSTDTNYISVRFECLKENLDASFAILSQILQEPTFNEDKLQEIKTRAATSIGMKNDEPDAIRDREFDRLMFGSKSPFFFTPEYEYLDNITRDDIVNVYKQFVTPDNMLVGVLGPLEMKEVQDLFEKHLGKWNAKAIIPPMPEIVDQPVDFKIALADKSDLNQSYFRIGHLGFKENIDEIAKVRVFNAIFSDTFGRLMNKVRVKMGLTYGTSGGIRAYPQYRGVTSFATYTKTESTIDAMKAILDEIDLIRKEKVTEQELQNAKDFFQNAYVFQYETPADVLFQSMFQEFNNYPQDFDKKIMEDVKKVTVDDVLEIAKKYLDPSKFVIMLVANEKEIKGDLSQFGKIKKIDYSIKPPAMKEKIPEATPESLAKGKKVIETMFDKNFKGYKNLKAVSIQMDIKRKFGPQEVIIGTQLTKVYPDKEYSEMSVMGMKFEMVKNGKKGIARQMGQEKVLPESELQETPDLFDIYSAKDKYTLQYLKEDTINGKTYDVIYCTNAQNKWKKFYVNKATLLVDIEEEMGKGSVVRNENSDYKVINNIAFAMKSVGYENNAVVAETTIKDLKVNPTVDPAIFNVEPKK